MTNPQSMGGWHRSDTMVGRLVMAMVVAVALMGTPTTAFSGPFDQGRMRLSLGGGKTGTFGKSYFAVSGGFGYFVVKGLEVGLGGSHLFGSDPAISQLTPQARYVLHFVKTLKPYGGVFYRHWFIGGEIDDMDSVGVRAGAFFISGVGLLIGGGAVHEVITSKCSGDCQSTYPELIFSITL